MSQPILVINGSARSNNNTDKLVQNLLGTDIKSIQLCQSKIAHYDYEGNYDHDDEFNDIVNQMIAANTILLATPVYWYTMSGHMKVFLDRWTDLVTIHKEKGRALKGKRLAVIAQSTSDTLPKGFVIPIKLTAEYMNMKYIGDVFWDMRNPLQNTKSIQEKVLSWL